jgi:O-antigen/teichoic acid export membrane protein
MLRGMRATTVAVSRRRLTVATAAQLGGRVVGAFLGVLVAATLARSLTRPQFGELSLVLTILALAGGLSDLGIGRIAVREMARRPQDRARIAGALCLAQLTMGIALGVVGLLVAFALLRGTQARTMAVFAMATIPLGAVGGLTIAAQARLRPELVIIPSLVQNVLWLAVVVVLGAANGALSLYGLGALGAALVQSAVIIALTVRVTNVTFAGTRGLIVDLLRMGWPLGLAGMFVTAYYRIDALLLFHYRGATANAYYSAAYRVLDVLQILPGTVSAVLLPLLASAERGGAGHDRIRQLFQFAIGLLLAVAVPVAICGAILSPGVVRLIYGAHFHRSVYLLQILLPAFIPICLGYVLTSQLILHGLLRPYVVITMIGAVLNVVANALAIPRYGAPAAAWTTLATELLVMAAIAAVVDRRLRLSLPVGRGVRCLAAATLTGAAVWAVRSEPLIVGLLVAAIVYPPCLLVSRAVSVAELRALLTREAAANA